MRRGKLAACAFLLPLLALTACQGRTTADVEPDGSPVEEVSVTETASPAAARDALRRKVNHAGGIMADTLSTSHGDIHN